jgi:succinyl-CoA synthetase beta subunit
MLLDKPIQSGSVITIKLNSGEELLARYESETDQQIVVSSPSVLTANATGVGMIPWIISAQSRVVKLNKTAVVTFVSTDSEISKTFIQATSSIKMV